MKTFLSLLLCGTIATGCSVQRYQETYYKTDFRPYTQQGFVISPLQTYAIAYEPIADIRLEIIPGDVPQITATSNNGEVIANDLYGTQAKQIRKDPTTDEMIKQFVDYAISLGANGILNYKLEIKRKTVSGKYGSSSYIVGYDLTGFAVFISEKEE